MTPERAALQRQQDSTVLNYLARVGTTTVLAMHRAIKAMPEQQALLARYDPTYMSVQACYSAARRLANDGLAVYLEPSTTYTTISLTRLGRDMVDALEHESEVA